MSSEECSCISIKIEALTTPVQHAEGPHWDQRKSVLYFVDTFQATVYRFDPGSTDNRLTKQKIEGSNSVGVIIPLQFKENEFVVAADRDLYKLKWNTKENDTGILEKIKIVDEDKPKNQFNDGKADANGRLWIGTLTREEDFSVTPFGGSLYRFDNNLTENVILEDTSISNGLAWSSDNRRFFYSDSETRKIMVYAFEQHGGTLGEGRVLFDLEDHPKYRGIADGLTIDNYDNLWVALYGGHGVLNIDGQNGRIIRFIKVPATYCTSVCFGGPAQEVLFVTTSNFKLTAQEKRKEADAGAVFAIRGLGVTGPPNYNGFIEE